MMTVSVGTPWLDVKKRSKFLDMTRQRVYNPFGGNMKKILFSLLMMLSVPFSFAAPSPVTIETGWNYYPYFAKCTGVASCAIDFTAANPGNNFVGIGPGVSISSLNVTGFSWSVLSVGANATFTISQLIQAAPSKTISPTSGTDYNGPSSGFNDSGHQTAWPASGAGNSISTSTAITAVSGIPLNGQFQALVTNPYLTFSSLNTAATVYLWAEVGIKRQF